MRLMVGVPTHSGTLTTASVDCLLRLQGALLARGDSFEIEFYSGPIISDLRNAIVADFLYRGADTLLMIDADTGTSPDVLLRMIDFGRPLVGCLYPKRMFVYEEVQGKTGELRPLMTRAMNFVGKLESLSSERIELVREGPFARALHVGTGLLLIRRELIEQMGAAYPDLKGRGFNPEAFGGERFAQNWGFFNQLPIATGGSNLAEDFSFCVRWRQIGGEVWADIEAVITHVGTHRFAASFAEYVAAHDKIR